MYLEISLTKDVYNPFVVKCKTLLNGLKRLEINEERNNVHELEDSII